jgi:hypothetical protein
MTALPPEVKDRVLDAVRREPARTRPETRRAVAMVVVAGFLTTFCVTMMLGGFVGGERPAAYLVLSTAGWLAMAGIATWGAIGRGRSMVGRSTRVVRTVALVTAPVMAVWVLVAWAGWPTLPVCPAKADFLCLAFTLVLALGPFAAFLFVRRHTDPIHPRLSGAALGAASGAWGAVAMHVRCICADPTHLLVAHVVPIVIFAVAGWMLGARVLGISAERPMGGEASD